MNSDYIEKEELQRALERHNRDEVVVIPIIISACTWRDHSEISALQVLPANARPIYSWLNKDEAFVNVVEGIKSTILNFQISQNEKPQLSTPNLHDLPTKTSNFKKEPQEYNLRRRQINVSFDENRLSKLLGMFLIFLAFYFLIAFTSYCFTWQNDHDLVFRFSWEIFLGDVEVDNWLGRLGAFLADSIIYWGFGVSSFGFVYLLYQYGLDLVRQIPLNHLGSKVLWTIQWMTLVSIIGAFVFQSLEFPVGGVFGQSISEWLQKLLGVGFTALFLLILTLTAIPGIRLHLQKWIKKST